MYIFVSCLVLFFILFFLMSLYQSFVWNSGWVFYSGLRCWVGSFECGFVSSHVVEDYFSSTYFILLVFFVVFDLEISLLLNMPLQGVLFKNFMCYFLFLSFLFFGFGLEILKGYVDWSNWNLFYYRC